ncbi:MAG: transporter substrate-binding protein, partial [Marmoricola sp.]|nr:transporter substrate-binding protein [Marmoricola sp.]
MTMGHARKAFAAAGVVLLAAAGTACGSSGSSSGGSGDKVAFLMPDTGSTRYELHDRPGFEKKLKELCSSCS